MIKNMFPPGQQEVFAARSLPLAAIFAACMASAGPAAAQSADPRPVASDFTHQVTVMAGACANCHGTDGAYAGAIPAIAGRPADVLEAQLLDFKKQDPGPNNTVMGRLAKGFTDEELRQLAQYYAAVVKR